MSIPKFLLRYKFIKGNRPVRDHKTIVQCFQERLKDVKSKTFQTFKTWRFRLSKKNNTFSIDYKPNKINCKLKLKGLVIKIWTWLFYHILWWVKYQFIRSLCELHIMLNIILRFQKKSTKKILFILNTPKHLCLSDSEY